MFRILLVKFLIYFNRILKKYGQNTFCKKRDVKLIVWELSEYWNHNPVAQTRFRSALEDIENLRL